MTGTRRPSVLARVAREPLVWFLAIGASLFALRPAGAPAAPDEDRIVVGAERIEQMAALFTRSWMRPPTAGELRGLVRSHVLEEVYVRQARALGLDRDDPVIRRRLRQKLEFLGEPQVELLTPDDAELAAYLAANPERFRLGPRLTFRQVYVSPDRHGDAAEGVVDELLRALRAGESAAGDPSLLPEALADAPAREVAARFGAEFAAALEELPVGEWRRVDSGYGAHLVRVDTRVPGRLPELDEVRPAVVRAWTDAELQASKERREAELLERFEVVIEWPELPAGDEEAAQ